MKKIISLILVIAIILLVGCADVEYAEADTQTNDIQDDVYYIQDDGYYEIYVDKETGVNYVAYTNHHKKGGGITPRLNADGTPFVSEVKGNE